MALGIGNEKPKVIHGENKAIRRRGSYLQVARVLRSRGYDVISAHEAGMRGKKDDEQLEYSTRHGRVVRDMAAVFILFLISDTGTSS
jgi:hypothetical protein